MTFSVDPTIGVYNVYLYAKSCILSKIHGLNKLKPEPIAVYAIDWFWVPGHRKERVVLVTWEADSEGISNSFGGVADTVLF
jgi:hypothetical protein